MVIIIFGSVDAGVDAFVTKWPLTPAWHTIERDKIKCLIQIDLSIVQGPFGVIHNFVHLGSFITLCICFKIDMMENPRKIVVSHRLG